MVSRRLDGLTGNGIDRNYSALNEPWISWLSWGGVVYMSKLLDKAENKFISRVS